MPLSGTRMERAQALGGVAETDTPGCRARRQHFGREAVSLDAFRACRLYPFTAFNFFATPTMGATQG